jgi:hypothetical protein
MWLEKRMEWFSLLSGKRAHRPKFSEAIIQSCLTLKSLFSLAPKQTTCLVGSLFQLSGLARSVLDLCRPVEAAA